MGCSNSKKIIQPDKKQKEEIIELKAKEYFYTVNCWRVFSAKLNEF